MGKKTSTTPQATSIATQKPILRAQVYAYISREKFSQTEIKAILAEERRK